MTEHERIHLETRAEWRAWLEQHHDSSQGVGLIHWRAASGRARMSYDDIVEEALCYGWIDGRMNRLDDERSVILMTPRSPGSTWARSNKERVERLIAEDRMTDAGHQAVATAKANGSWTVLDDIDALVVPDDLAAALAADEQASRYFEAFPPSARKLILYWIKSAKRVETRQRRIAETVRLAAVNVRAASQSR